MSLWLLVPNVPLGGTLGTTVGSETPNWIHPFRDAGYLAEGAWILGTNIAYAVIGVAILQSGLVATWSGWAAIGLGVLIPVVVLVTRVGFPQLGLLVPFIVGISVIIESFKLRTSIAVALRATQSPWLLVSSVPLYGTICTTVGDGSRSRLRSLERKGCLIELTWFGLALSFGPNRRTPHIEETPPALPAGFPGSQVS